MRVQLLPSMSIRLGSTAPKSYGRVVLHLGLIVVVGLISSCQRITMGVIKNEPTSASADWGSIPLSKPVIAKWDVQVIYVNVSTKHQSSTDPLGIRLEDGSIIAPEIELVSKTGQREPFRFVGFSNSDLVFENDHIARGSSFSELRIRSLKPLVCSQIRWVSYMPKDTKTGVP
jgi:hypothetical protein